MLGGGLQYNRSKNDDRFYTPAGKGRRNKNRTGMYPNPATSSGFEPVKLPLSNIERFFQAVTPSIPADFLSKTRMIERKTCDVEYKPYFKLSDLWESFKEWSAYGAGVPLVLSDNDCDSVVQYYVPYLSAIQIYVPSNSRHRSEDSDRDYFSRDSSSAGSSDSERGRGLAYSRGQRNQSHDSDISFKMDVLSLRDQHNVLKEGLLHDKSESPKGCLLFEYLEHDQPHAREPLADKIADLALRFPELKSLRSCDVLGSSWFSVAWYPIYRIPMGPTLKDLEACFLTYHSLYTPAGDTHPTQAPAVVFPSEIDGTPRISLPVVGFASYKLRGSLWTSNGGRGRQLVNSLLQAADRSLGGLQVNHPDYLFFCRNR